MYEQDYDPTAMKYQQRLVNRQIRKLRHKASLDPRDPDAITEEEFEQLKALEDWEP